jgi:hypothetical protein
VALFVLSGFGNGSTYKMIPAVFHDRCARREPDPVRAEARARRLSGAVIGIAGAVGAFGGVLVNVAFRQSFLAYHTGDGAYLAFIACYLVCCAVTWAGYLRPAGAVAAGETTGSAVTDSAVTGGAVMGSAVTDSAVTDSAVTGGALTAGAVTGGALTAGTVTGGVRPGRGAAR